MRKLSVKTLGCKFWASILVVLTLLILNTPTTNAQEIIPGVDEQISFDVSPEIPEPNSTVTATVTSFMTDLNKAKISWYINGSLFESSTGKKTIEFQSGDVGSVTTVRVGIQKQEGGYFERSYTIQPADVSLVYEADTYTPIFYQGKSLASYQSDIKLIAIPNFVDRSGNKISSDQIVYTWEINGTVYGSLSGVGVDTFDYTPNIINRPIEVIVKASPVNSDQIAREVKTFEFIEPFIVFYERNPLYGTLIERALSGSIELNKQEVEVTASPYFFTPTNLSFSWFLNGKKIQSELSNILAFRRTDDRPGRANVQFKSEHNERLLQSSSDSFVIQYREGKDFEF